MYIDLPISHICFPSGPDKQLQLWSTAIKRMKTKVNKTIKHSKSFIIFKYLNRIFMIFIKTFFISAIVLQEVFNWVLKEIPDGVNVASTLPCDWSRSLKRWKMRRFEMELV